MRCTALTKHGKRCKLNAQSGGTYCYIHRKRRSYTSHKRFLDDLPSNYELKTYKLTRRKRWVDQMLRKLFEEDDICTDAIPFLDWVLDNYMHNDVLEVLFDKDTQKRVAFAFVKENYKCTFEECTTTRSNSSIYVDLICGKRFMKYLMALITEKAIKNKIAYITLSALPEVILWYKKNFDFKLSLSCKEDTKISKALDKFTKEKKIWTRNDILTNRKFTRFLTSLEGKHIAKGALDKVCQGVGECHIHGYYMTLCLR